MNDYLCNHCKREIPREGICILCREQLRQECKGKTLEEQWTIRQAYQDPNSREIKGGGLLSWWYSEENGLTKTLVWAYIFASVLYLKIKHQNIPPWIWFVLIIAYIIDAHLRNGSAKQLYEDIMRFWKEEWTEQIRLFQWWPVGGITDLVASPVTNFTGQNNVWWTTTTMWNTRPLIW